MKLLCPQMIRNPDTVKLMDTRNKHAPYTENNQNQYKVQIQSTNVHINKLRECEDESQETPSWDNKIIST